MKHIDSRATALQALAFAGSLLLAGVAQAQSDPTRPSAAWLATQKGAGAPHEADLGEGGPANAQILLSSASRRFAVVDGHVVRPGESYNGARLVSIGENGAVWDRGGARETPSMTPAVQRTTVAAAQAHEAKPATKKHKEPK